MTMPTVSWRRRTTRCVTNLYGMPGTGMGSLRKMMKIWRKRQAYGFYNGQETCRRYITNLYGMPGTGMGSLRERLKIWRKRQPYSFYDGREKPTKRIAHSYGIPSRS